MNHIIMLFAFSHVCLQNQKKKESKKRPAHVNNKIFVFEKY